MIVESKKGKTQARQTLVVKTDDGEAIGSYDVPTALGALADHVYARQERRLTLNRQAAELEDEEKAIKTWVIEHLPKKELASGIAGKVGRLELKKGVIPTLKDPKKFFAYLKKTGDFDLLQRRLNAAAVEARWEAKKAVPGVVPFDYVKVSVTAVKQR